MIHSPFYLENVDGIDVGLLTVFKAHKLDFSPMGKENRFFFFPLPFAVTFHLIEACCSGSSQSPPGWMKTHPMLSHLPPQSEWGRQLSNPLCNSFSVCDGGDTEGGDKTRTGQMPSMLCTHRAQLRAVHVHHH